MNKKKLSLIVLFGLIIISIGIGVKVHMDNEKKQEEFKIELKRMETEIVKDLSTRYEGVYTVKFYGYSIAPMGTMEITLSINGKEDKRHYIEYDVEPDESTPEIAVWGSLNPLKEGNSNFKNIKIEYNLNEDK